MHLWINWVFLYQSRMFALFCLDMCMPKVWTLCEFSFWDWFRGSVGDAAKVSAEMRRALVCYCLEKFCCSVLPRYALASKFSNRMTSFMLAVELVKLPCFGRKDACIVGGQGLALWNTIAYGWLLRASSWYEEGTSSLYCRKSYASVTGTLSNSPIESDEPCENLRDGCYNFNLKLFSNELAPTVSSLPVLPAYLRSPSAELVVRFGSPLPIKFSPLSVSIKDEE